MELRPPAQRVVITGMGALSPLGHSVQELWNGLLQGRSGIAPITQFDASHIPVSLWKAERRSKFALPVYPMMADSARK